MAWQVLLVRLPEGTTSLSTLPTDFAAEALGPFEDVRARVLEVSHIAAETINERLVVLRNEEVVIEAELGGIAAVDRVLLRVLGSDAAFPLVCSLARAVGASAVDCETDRVLDADAEVPDTLRQWQKHIEDLR